ncbi:MAG: SDR family NAD(P)-dependent oxidoreductase [Bacteroidales bacterium]|jgi:short-subunit dehydrogenase|nr:SDR family NAD(P)-dependent oxidoreductase [Bacteroidales bacterium]
MKKPGFEGKVAVITGSSRGIGKGIALSLARKGAFIVLNGRNEERLGETKNDILKINSNVISVCCDVSTAEGGRYLIDETIRKFGKLDILVNNVGISMRGRFADLDPAVVKTIFESNILGTTNPSIPAMKYLRESQGSIIFISSAAGIRGLPGLSAYCASKMALRAFAESIRLEETRNGIHAGLIYVGYTENEKDKETIAADGSRRLLAPRSGKGVQTIESVARGVVRNLEKRKFITVLSPVAKLNAFMQPRFPWLVEYMIMKNLKKFEEGNR